MSNAVTRLEQPDIVRISLQAPSDAAAIQAVGRQPQLHSVASVQILYEEVVNLCRVDLRSATRLAAIAQFVAAKAADDYAEAWALRATGHVLHLAGKHQQAVENYEAALRILERLGKELDVARTASGAQQALIYLGRYEQAQQWAERAREVFVRLGDGLRIARLDINVANLLYRQDRFREAIQLYRRAYEELLRIGEHQDVAIALRNMAVCYISLNEFDQAIRTYREARDYCERHNFAVLVAEVDYNIAYLYYMRGEYEEAIRLYDQTRALCRRLRDRYHRALCDLDESEMYLELNVIEAGAGLAKRAYAQFVRLHMDYEAGKALAFSAIAERQRGNTRRALRLFDRSRRLFERERNPVWPALIDLYKALVLFEEGRYEEAERLSRDALQAFTASSLMSKVVLCELLLARIRLATGDVEGASAACSAALARVAALDLPALEYKASFVAGLIQEARGDAEGALVSFGRAHEKMEQLRSRLAGEELKISFLKDKLEVYERLVWLSLTCGDEHRELRAFEYIERAKSRSLADLIAVRAAALEPRIATPGVHAQVRTARENLESTYRRIRSEELTPDVTSSRLSLLHRQTRQYEADFDSVLGSVRTSDPEFVALQTGGAVTVDALQDALGDGAVLLEYYVARGLLIACIADRKGVRAITLGPVRTIRDNLRLLQFQMSKFRLGGAYARDFSQALLEATRFHLRELWNDLVAPVLPHLTAGHLVIVPHAFLHYLPFHALWDGKAYMGDRFTISYAPSASVYALCAAKPASDVRGALVLGIPDELAPRIEDEVRAVASALPDAKLLLGQEADEQALRSYGPGSRFVHVATHGMFQHHNPMYSSILLGNSELNLFSLYQLRFASDLVTLSGCGTGLNAVVGADELIGLVRGLLYAGARSVLVTLWDVHDESTAEFMKAFYTDLANGVAKAVAVQRAMATVRNKYPHPYFWAPFVLVGSYTDSVQPVSA